MDTTKHVLPRWCWLTSHECVVEILKTGHYPTTVMVELPQGQRIEVEISDLEVANGR